MSDFPPEFIRDCFCVEADETLAQWERCCLDLAAGPNADVFARLFRAAHNLKGSSASVGLTGFRDCVHVAEDRITLLRDGKEALTPDAMQDLLRIQERLSRWTAFLKDHPEKGEDFPAHEEALHTSSMRSGVASGVTSSSANANHSVVRVASEKLDALLRICGEASTRQEMIWHGVNTSARGNEALLFVVHQSKALVRELYEGILGLRLQPVGPVFQRLERVVLDTAAALGKSVRVETRGGDVELDKSFIEGLGDALIHVVRNAVDHGLETPEARSRLGKTGHGTVRLEASSEAGRVTLRISDDGRGIDTEKVLAKARSLDLVPSHVTLTSEEVYRLLLIPGFSTAEVITDVSGRGVGLDVVRSQLESLGGALLIESDKGRGTTFVISLQARLSLLDVLLVEAGGRIYAVPLADVAEVLELASYETSSLAGQARIVRVRGRSQAVSSLAAEVESLGAAAADLLAPAKCVKDRSADPERLPPIGLVSTSENENRVLAVTALRGRQQVILKEATGLMAHLPFVLGCAVLADGSPTLVLNLSRIANETPVGKSPVKGTAHAQAS